MKTVLVKFENWENQMIEIHGIPMFWGGSTRKVFLQLQPKEAREVEVDIYSQYAPFDKVAYKRDKTDGLIKPQFTHRSNWANLNPLKGKLTTVFKNETRRIMHLRDEKNEKRFSIPPFMTIEAEVDKEGDFGNIAKVVITESVAVGGAVTINNKIPVFTYERQKRKK